MKEFKRIVNFIKHLNLPKKEQYSIFLFLNFQNKVHTNNSEENNHSVAFKLSLETTHIFKWNFIKPHPKKKKPSYYSSIENFIKI